MIDATGMPQSAVVIGATSDIAREVVARLVERRLERVVLTGRDPAALETVSRELGERGVKVRPELLDLTVAAELEDVVSRASRALGEIDLVLVAAGDLGTAVLGDLDTATLTSLVSANFTGPASVIAGFARQLQTQGQGRIVVISSVAGVRVRKANFVYGSAKAGLDGFALGLSDVLEGSGVVVTVVRPGFVRTRMTAHLHPPPFAVDAAEVAGAVVRALETDASIVWVPPILRLVFAGLRLFPRSLWRRLPA